MSEKFRPQEAADWSKEKLASQETLRTKDFAVVTQALGEGMANVYSGNDPALEEFLQQHNPDNQPYLLIADHSFGGRNFKLADNVSHVPYFHDEGLNGGWSLLRESDLQMVEMSSATSKTKVRAEKDDTGVWNLTLDVPQIEGQPYHGAYWKNFQEAAEMTKANVEDQAE